MRQSEKRLKRLRSRCGSTQEKTTTKAKKRKKKAKKI